MAELWCWAASAWTPLDGATGRVVEPATGRRWPRSRRGPPRTRRRAVDVATRAFEEGAWPRTARPRARARADEGLVPGPGAAGGRSRELEARNGGKPISAARGEIDIVANVFEYWGGAANKIIGETIPIVPPGLDVTLREPVGVCALITPWNFPAVIA